MSVSWFQRYSPRPNARARLFCFPHAGGGASVFRLWSAGLPADLDVCAIQLPGRENRLREPPLDSVDTIVEALLTELAPQLDRPFAFFGHSMGAIIAFETARALSKQGWPEPNHLFVSARRPPHLADLVPPLHCLPDDEFVAGLNHRYGGIPAEVAQHADLMELLLPGLRADIRALETHQPVSTSTLSCPISAFGGSEDRFTPRFHLEAWSQATRGSFRTRLFAGGHFYIEPRRVDLLADLSVALA